MIPIQTDAARRRFPKLNHQLTSEDLTVISDEGAVYFGPKAWLMVLWSLCRYREWSYRLAAPEPADDPTGGVDGVAAPLSNQPRRRLIEVSK